MQLLRQAIEQGNVLLDVEANSMREVFDQSLQFLVEKRLIDASATHSIADELMEREKTAPTAIGHSVAVPHVYREDIPEQIILWVRVKRPLNLAAPDGIPTRFFIFLLGHDDQAGSHLDSLSNVARLMSDDEFRYESGQSATHVQLLRSFDGFIERSGVRPIRDADAIPEGLQYTGKIGGGMLGDFARRWPHYMGDWLDGLHRKTVSSTFFLYFACIAPAVIFGGVLDQETASNIGVVEIVIGTAICGIFYALFSGQPLIILGGTGPLLIFTIIVFDFCAEYHGTTLPLLGENVQLPFLETRAVIGVLAGVFLIILALADASCLMRYFTRFTDEIFAALISIIFVHEAVKLLLHIFERTHLAQDSPEFVTVAAALFSLLLAVGTFYLAMVLSRFRRTRYLHHSAREFLADFGPTLALVAMTLLAMWFVKLYPDDLKLDRLNVKSSITPTVDREWLLNPFIVDWSIWLVAIVPASLLAVLVYADQNITARLVNSSDHHLQKGEAYHWDLGLMGILISVCSLFGWPWLVAATVRSLNHVRSLATLEEVTRYGETRERIIHVQENRITPLAIHILIGASIFLLPLLREVPMAVLFGLFLFMGIVSLAGNQFVERLSMWLMDTKLYPSTHFTRRVPRRAMHAFTLLQLLCLAALIWVKNSAIAILFPLLLICFIPIRLFAGRWFDDECLEALDSDETPEEEETRRTE